MSKKLLTFLTLLTLFFGVGWAATATYSLTPNQANTGTSSTSYITSLTEFTYNQVSWKMTQWNPSSLQIKTNQDKPASQFRFYNTSAFSGKITKVVITFSALTVADASKLMFIGGTSEVSGTTGGTAGTWNATNKTLTWEPSASDEFTFFGFYQNGKAATGTNKLAITDAIVVTYETGGSTSTTYDIDVTNGSADPNPAAEGAIVTLTPTIPDGKVIDWENTTVSPSTVVINHDDYTFTMPGEAVTVSFAFKDAPVHTNVFQLISSSDDLEIDARYIIVNTALKKALLFDGTSSSTGDVTISNNQITVSDNATIFTLGGSSGSYTFKNGANTLINSNKTTLRLNSDGGDDDKWAISFNDINAFIDHTLNGNERYIRYSSGSEEFRAYTAENNYSSSLPVQLYKEVETTGVTDGYYLVGDLSGDGWPATDAYKFISQGDGIYVLDTTIPSMGGDGYIHFKIAKIENNERIEYSSNWGGGYPVYNGHNTDIPMSSSDQEIYYMPDNHRAIFTLDINNMKFSVEKPQLFMKGGFNGWTELVEMTPDTENGGWTTTMQLGANTEFRFYDAWHVEQGGAGYWIFNHDMGNELNIYNNSMEIFKMVEAGKYTFHVNSAKTKLVVTAEQESTSGDEFVLVTDATTLNAGDDVIIASSDVAGAAKAMGDDRGDNRAAVDVTISDELKVTPGEDVQIVTLESTTITYDGETFDGWLFNTGAGYLYAASTSKNWLRTGSLSDAGDNAKAYIENENNSNAAFIQFYGTNTHDVLKYNGSNNPPIFSCYLSTSSMSSVYLYKRAVALNRVETPVITPEACTVIGGKLKNVSITCATEDATIYYTDDGTDPRTSGTRKTYTGPFVLESIGGNEMVIAYAVKTGMADSHLESVKYLFTSPEAPTFNPEDGTVSTQALNVSIISEYIEDEGCKIYYMLDPETAPNGSNDVKDNGILYQNAIEVSGNREHTIYAIVELNNIKSDVATATYTITTPISLADLCQNGVVGNEYTINEALYVAHVNVNGNSIWVKDADGSSVVKDTPAADDMNYEIVVAGNPHEQQADYDQSNWLEVQLTSGSENVANLLGTTISANKITGTFTNKTNPTMTGVTIVEGDYDVTQGDGYTPNYYCTANFDGSQNATAGAHSGEHFFFVKPKPQEYAQIVWAQWDGTKFVIPTGDGINEHGFTGEFNTNMELNVNTTYAPQTGKAYNFRAIVRKVAGSSKNTTSDTYMVYPLNLADDVITDIADVAGKTVTGIRYYNVAGMASDRPFEGVNIVVTTYTDGSRTSTKVLR